MAAKVVMVAVPTVLGIASIRVYMVSEPTTGEGWTREKLSVYTPALQSSRILLAEKPTVVQSGLGTIRESLTPCVQAVKGACVSVKNTSVNLYHAGEDAYYFLIDPPPGFLPRMGIITMSGLLGMILARKGSRFTRSAVPLCMIGTGALVCYPAQTVAVLKVGGNNLYAAGQWSRATVSSLLASKPEPAPEPQPNTVPKPQCSIGTDTSPAPETISHLHSPPQAKSTSDNDLLVERAPPAPEFSPGPEEPGLLAEETPAETHSEPPPEQASREPVVIAEVQLSAVEPAVSVVEPSSSPPPPLNSHKTVVGPLFPERPALPAEPADPVLEESSASPPPAAEQTPTGTSKGGSGLQVDPSLMDYGQSNPEDADLYSTRT